MAAPASLVVGAWGLVSRRRGPRTDPLLACFLLWGGWLVVLAGAFSLATTINSYYTAALVPAMAAIIGAGVRCAWPADRSRMGWRAGLVVVTGGTAGYAAWLVAGSAGEAPGWLLPAVIAVGAVATVVAAVGGGLGRRPVAVAIGAGLVAGLLVPAVASAGLVVRHQGAFDTPFEAAGKRAAITALFVQTPAQVQQTIPQLEAGRRGAHYLLATQTAALASVFIEDSGEEAFPIGGFTGTAPSPTLEQLKAGIRASQFHLVLAGPSRDPRLRWIAGHCHKLPFSVGPLSNYYCTPEDAG